MNKITNITLLGICLILAGIIMSTAETVGVKNAKIIVPLLFAIAGIFSLIYSKANKQLKAAAQFQMLQGIGLIIFAGIIAFIPDSLSRFLIYVAYFMLLFGLLEIIFSFAVMNSKTPIIKEILIFRMLGGFIIAIGGFVLLLTTFSDEFKGITVAGVLTILIGISNVVFASKVKNLNV